MCQPDAKVRFTEVKVQMPMGGDLSHALVYDKERRFSVHIPTHEVARAMAGNVKAYFRAKIVTRGSETEIQLLEQVESNW